MVWVQELTIGFVHNKAHGGGSLQKMNTSPISFWKKKGHMWKKSFPKQTYDIRKRKQMSKGGGRQVQKVGKHEAEVVTWHGE